MKRQLRQIYDDLSNGHLSQREALERIKAIKQKEQQGEGAGTLLATPVWQASSAAASDGAAPIAWSEHLVVLCELSTVAASDLELGRCLSLAAKPDQTIAERYAEHALACFERIQAILLARPQGKVLIQIVVPDHQEQVLLAGLSGLLKTAALENPQIFGQLILVPAGATAAELGQWLKEETHGGLDPMVRYAARSRQVLRWQELGADAAQQPVAFQEDGVYLITGGLGSLGVLFATEILGRTSGARVVLTGRATLNPEKQAVLDGLGAPGRVSYRQLDLGDLDRVKQGLDAIREEHGRLDGILHCAGMVSDNFLLKKTAAEFREVLAAKVTGTSNLDLAGADAALDFFVLFSSVVGAMGNVGQADYATANAFMDQFAAYRNGQVAGGQRHGLTRSVNWPAWEAGAMGADPATREQLHQATGIRPMRTATGLETFDRSLALPGDQLLVAEGDVARIRRALHTGRPIQPEPTVAETKAAAAVEGDNLTEKTEEYLRRQCAELLKLPVDAIDPQAALERYGIDSILAMKLTNHLEKTFGTLSKTLFFEYQTIRELTEYFVRSQPDRLAALFPRTQAKPVETPAEPVPATSRTVESRRFSRRSTDGPRERTDEPIAIIGLSGRYPEAVDLDAYWQNLAAGKDCIIEVPKERWDWRQYFTEDRTQGGHHYSKWGGFIAGVDEFDPQFFNISPKEARFIDPQERLFLQHAWMAVEDAGYSRTSLQTPAGQDLPGQVGVYAGVMYTEYQLFGDKTMGVAPSGASIANRVSYALNLHGPSVTLDTMCSSSLTAIHFACLDLQLGRTTLAIAGGVNVSVHPNKYLFLSAGQFISSDGRCQSFGEGGDGYIPAEGVGVVILKRLADAQRDGDHIYGVIRGSALNHGGKTNGFTVPNPQAQASVIGRALAECHTDPRHISYLEAHGTGTKLGDPIEIAALSKAFSQQTEDTGFCLIGSAKSNIGHCESAAGIAGLTKVLLQMQHRQVVPSLHSAELNPHIDFAKSPFVVNQSLKTWEQPVIDGRTLPRIAGISSFGAGGSNAHMIIEEYPQPVTPRTSVSEPVVIVLSARTPEQLRQKTADLLGFVRARQSSIDLLSVAYTLQAGREALDERVAFVVSSVEQLAERLQAHVAGQQALEDVYSGQVKRNKDALSVFTADSDLQQTVGKWIANRKLSRLADLWVKGLELDWSKLYGQATPMRMSLPTYPFARERYWVEVTAPAAPVAPQQATAAVLHPLLHNNTSDLSQQSYTSTFRGDEAFLNGRVLPAAAYLEMARVAVEKASRTNEGTSIELRNVVWAEPFVADGTTPVSIALLANDPEQIAFEIYSGQELVHCQGHAVSTALPATATLDLEQLGRRQGSTETLVQLRQPRMSGDVVLHPGVIDSALQACGTWLGEPRLPFAIDTLRVLSPCTPETAAWIRHSQGSRSGDAVVRLDVDLCDANGTVCVQIQGVSLRRMAVEAVVEPMMDMPVIVPVTIAPVAIERKEITFVRQQQAAPLPVAPKKKAAISLAAPSAVASGAATSTPGRPAVTLTSAGQGSQIPAPSAVRLFDGGNGIFSIEIAASRSNDTIAHVLQALERVQQESSAKVLLLSGIEHCFLRGGREELSDAIERKLFHGLASFPRPVIAVLQGDVVGAGFLAAALCDFLVAGEDVQYGYTDGERGLYPAPAEAALFAERFGKVRAQDFLTSAPLTGGQLWARGWTCPVVPWEQVETHAQQLATALATKSQAALQLLKRHLTRRLAVLVNDLGRVDASEVASVTAEQVLVIQAGNVAALVQGMANRADAKAIVLAGDGSEFLQAVREADVLEAKRVILDYEIPVIAALHGDAGGNAWLIAQFCDAAVYSGQGRYSAANVAPTAAAIFEHRFGSKAARELLLTGAASSGDELQRRVGALTVVEFGQVLPTAIEVATSWATLPRATRTAWRNQTAAIARQIAGGPLPESDSAAQVFAPSISLRSSVVTATVHPNGVVVVKMEDRDAKNMFSEALVAGIREAFAQIEQTPACRVVVLTGYDSYFASGGTKETLLAIQQGTRQFTDDKIFQAALDCRLPVIAAMQGHGLGAGWCLGMFADLAVLSEESRYVSPYMSYGFTPGAGATHILPETIGQDLATESLLTAQPYTGRELQDRGITVRVLPRTEVLPAALTLAGQIAQSSRGRLVSLKQQWADAVREPLEETYRLELSMHEQTFVGRSDTLAQIETNFHPEAEAPAAVPVPQAVEVHSSEDGDLLPAVTASLRTLLAKELLLNESGIDEHAQFIDLGLDSIGGVSWIRKINDKYRTSIEAVKVYSYPTLAQLSRHVKEEAERLGTLSVPAAAPVVVAPVAPKPAVPAQKIVTAPAVEKLTSWRTGALSRFTGVPAPRPAEAIAVIGMAGQFPQANDVDAFWNNIAEGRNCISEIPGNRWDVNAYYQPGDAVAGKTNSQWLGALEEYDLFDPLFFNISPAEAELMDPQQRLFLQACWHSIENAGYAAHSFSGSKCGVFVGCSAGDYHQQSREHQLTAQGFTGSATSILAARISYHLNLQGPCISIDTACSSSLVAIADACDSLMSGDSEVALAGGVCVLSGPDMHIKTAQAGMLSPEGRCYTFDQRADGFVPGEGVGVVVLKRLADAQRDGDNILGVIQGWGVNQDGKTNGITAPNPESQTRLEQHVYDKFRIDPANIQLIEAHGTGTKLGDPIEVDGLKQAFAKYTQNQEYCALGSVKSNIGHTLTAAGIAGVIKLLLALKHKQLPPTINFDRLNEHIDLKGSPFYVNGRLQDWKAGAAARQAAISSFGFSGTNAHLVIGEHAPSVASVVPASGKVIVPLSARTAAQLQQKAADLLGFLRRPGQTPDLTEIAYTLQVGREAMDDRLGIVVSTIDQLIDKLQAFVNGETEIKDLHRGQVKAGRESLSVISQDDDVRQTLIEKLVSQKKFSKLAELWVKGLELDWLPFHGTVRPRRVTLPNYPFAKDRYWIETTPVASQVPAFAQAAVLHPLVHSNSSDFNEQRFTSQFSGAEFFLADHRVKGTRVLPGVCYLEMARAAAMASAPESAGQPVVLSNVTWMSPIVVDGPSPVHIALYEGDREEIEYEIYSNASGQEDAEVIHGQGRVRIGARENTGSDKLDWSALRAGCDRIIEASECYAAFSAMGIDYGPAHRGVRNIGVGRNAAGEPYLLAELELPQCVSETREQFGLHPSLMDSALQAAIGFLLAKSDSQAEAGKPSLPYSIEQLEILDRCPDHAYVHLRPANAERHDQTNRIPKLDLDLCDEDGQVCVRLQGFTTRVLERELGAPRAVTVANAEGAMATMPLVPCWDAELPPAGAQWPSQASRVLVVGGTAEQQQAIRARYPIVDAVDLSADGLVERLQAAGTIEHVLWLTPASEVIDVTDDRLLHEQANGVLGGLRLVKALLRLGYESKDLGWTVVTWQTQGVVSDDPVRLAHASVHGFVGSLAKEYTRWKVRLADLPLTEEWPLDALLSLPADSRGDAWAYRAGEWYRQHLVPCELPATQAATYRQGGVYVVIGGAGGIGETFSEHLIRNHQARMIWIGRRELNADIQAKIDRLAAFGPAPVYLRADATDRDALTRAYQTVKAQHGRVDGLVHAAIDLSDKSLAQMDEARFRASLTAKTDVSVRMAQVFADAQLDFVLFFSSMGSFTKAAGQSNYGAGCTFADAFASRLSQVWSSPVKVMNWGYWGNTGIVASAEYRARMARSGVGSIEPAEGMAALDGLLSAPMSQLALFKGQSPELAGVAVSADRITIAEPRPASRVSLSPRTSRVLTVDAEGLEVLQRLMGQLLFDQLRVLGLFESSQISEWKQQTGFPAVYDQWLDESIHVLVSAGYATAVNGRFTAGQRSVPETAALWASWDAHKAEWRNDANLGARVKLVDATLRALPEILTGKRRATDILFPSSSLALVEDFYKHDGVSEYFNAVLADFVVEFVAARRAQDPSAKVRIIELGAGTGGTSEGVFKRLAPHADAVAEYCYTDISKAFLMHAEEVYGPSAPYLTTRLLNVEQPLGPQGIEPGTFDLVIAANVLHATKNIRRTLRNAKAALKHNGVLLLNEALGCHLLAHLTFGLLEGWWLSEDVALRVPGTPSVAAEGWQRVLEAEGFGDVRFPALAAHPHGQQIVAAVGNGVIRQSGKRVQQTVVAAPALPVAVKVQPAAELVPAAFADRLRDKATAALKKVVGQALKLPVQQIDATEPLETYGIDSILVLRLVDALSGVFEGATSTIFFEYRTIEALVSHFLDTEKEAVIRWVGAAETVAAAPVAAETRSLTVPTAAKPVTRRGRRGGRFRATESDAPSKPAETRSEDVAIIGLSGRYPEAVNLDAYWTNLREGKDCIREVPKERWDWREYFSDDRSESGRHYSKFGGFIEGVEEFDPIFFNIAPKEAKSLDPQERLFLQHAWMAIEDAGYTRAALQVPDPQDLPGQVGVYVGVMYTEYQLLAAEASLRGNRMAVAPSAAGIANRVSSVLNVHGPSVTLDTMCSSSLTALHFACQDLKLGRTSLAIAGGVNVSVHANKYLLLSANQFISSDGRCQSFGSTGDGFIPGEGVGVVVLKRLSEAERDGDHIYGIIRGSALNHGGKTNGYTVPSPQAQSSVIGRALAESRIDARHISYIEAHGTGTTLGDPIEIAALSKAFQKHTADSGFCLIGSAKSNIGHCESAAAVAGLTKVLLQMQHEEIVPSLHSAQLNPHIDFAKTPFTVNQTLRPWEQPVIDGRKMPRIAGISSFGAGGSNAHMIVEEYPLPVPQAMTFENVAILLSARTAEQLQQKVRDLLAFVSPRQSSIDLASVAYTLQVGREAMDERLAFVVGSCEELVERLQAYLAGEEGGRYRGQMKRGTESVFSTDADLQQTVDKWFANQKLAKLADLWVNGLELDWSKLYSEGKPRRVSLPTYPFARERHWIDVTPGKLVAAKSTAPVAEVLHPLVHRNTSNLKEQRFTSAFGGDELFLAERRAADGTVQKTLLTSAYLEMARAAIVHALPERPETIELLNVAWAQEPVALGKDHPIHITVSANGDDEIEFEIYSQEIVLCQGRALVNQPAPAKIESAQFARLIQLQLPSGETTGDFVLHPSLIEAALQACAGTNEPFALESLQIVSPCTNEMVAWVRYGADAADLALRDAQGNVCVQIRGLRWQQAAVDLPVVEAETTVPVVETKIPIAAPAPKPVALAQLQPVPAPAVERKRVSVSLAAPGAPATAASASARPLVTLVSPAQGVAPAAPAVSLPVVSLPVVSFNDHGDGVFAIHVSAAGHSAKSVIAGILQAMERVQREASAKVLTISGFEHAFDYDTAVGQELYRRIVALPCPIVAVLRADAIGAGFLFAALCDFLVCSEDARFGYTDVPHHLYPTSAVADVLRERFGGVQAEDLLFVSTVSTGSELRAKGWTNPIVPASQVAEHALELASTLAGKSREALHLLKQHLSRRLAGLVDALTPIEAETATETADAATPGSLDALHLRLERPTESVLAVTMLTGETGAQLADLDRVFAAIRHDQSCKAVVLASEHPGFLPDGIADSTIATFQRLLVGARVPVVAALDRDARGNAWLVSQFCDATVYSRQGFYSAEDAAQMAPAVFAQRFGSDTARRLLLTGADYSGADLQQRTGTLIVAEQDRVGSAAIDLAGSWALLPRTVLASWKQHTEAVLRRRLNNLAAGWDRNDEDAEPAFTAPAPIALQSRVVTATAHPGGIVVVTMQDHEAKNMFSYAFNEGIREVFAHIEKTPAYKVVILTGYDQYFASGGTKENLLAIQSGQAKFTDSKIFQLPLDCRLPVIAAMQGHGIGGGWSLGMFADLVMLSEESRYVSPYMDYGFTPGAGATWILAEKIGEDLSRESLLTAQSYTGSALKARGLQLPVLPRADVVSAALALAQQIARAPRGRLIALKQQLTQSIHDALEETYRLELAMHEKTFVGRSDTLAQIETTFHQEAAPAPVVPQPKAEPVKAAVRGDGEASVRATLKALLADELQMRESDIDDHAAFVDLGLDSISGVSWVRKINTKYGTSIEATKVYVHPSLIQMSRYVTEEARQRGTLATEVTAAVVVEVPAAPVAKAPAPVKLAPARAAKQLTSRRNRTTGRVVASTAATREPEATERRGAEPIAIIGMAGQFPQARNVDEFWQNLAQGRNCITQVSPDRWDLNAHYQPGEIAPGKTNSQWLGALEDYALFDPLFFNISPTEAVYMDPQQRLFLQACWQSIENAGYDARQLSGSRTGVFVGAATGDYHQLSRAHQLTAQGFTGTAVSILAARISYFLNLQGPCVSIDTACSSSLVAMAQACDSLISRDTDLALAGGVYVMAGPEMHIRTAQAGMLSTEGRCFSFDQRADGFVMGEGVGVVVLKRLSDAQRDQDVILGLIEGWGVNQDGKTNGITAPNPESQTRLEQDVYEKYQIDPAGIQLIEAHGTATKLGDPIEVEGLKLAFSKFTSNKQYCALGSVKSNIGHTLTSAGVAGVIKLLQALKHRQLPPTINFERLNEHIDLTDSPFYVNTKLQDWELHGAATRRAAISSFGFSGTNAHLVVGEYVAPVAANQPALVLTPDTQAIVPLSARTAEQLRQKAVDLLAFLQQAPAADLLDVAYTLQVGRTAMDERLGFVVSTIDELTEKLQAFVNGEQRNGDAFQGQVRRNKETLALFSNDPDFQETFDKWIANRRVTKLLELWVKGLELDWTRLYGEVRPRRINLPVYPFARERYWIDVASLKQDAPADQPLMSGDTEDLNTSTAATEDSGAGTLLATPMWQASGFDGSAEPAYAEHHVILCELSTAVAEELKSLLPLSECLSLQPGDDEDIAERYSSHALACFERIQAILQEKPAGKVLVQIVVADEGEQAVLAGLSALLKTAALENPQFTGQLLLIEAELSVAALSSHLQEEKRRGLDPVVRYEQSVRQVLRWEGLEAEPDTAPIAFKDQGVYLITGGMGGLGLLFAKEILERTGDARVVLTGRAPWTAETEARLDALTSQVGRLSYRQVNLLDRDEVEQLIAGVRDEYRPLSGILHCAGMTRDNVIVKKSYDEFRQVLGPKVTGTFHLDQASRNVELDFFVLFSSIAAAVGNAGQADYATANAFMDQFAAYRNRQVAAKQRHGRTRSINWSLWEAGGMELDSATLALVQQATGMQPLRTATGMEAFYRSLVLPYDQILVVEGSTEKFSSYLQKARIFEAASGALQATVETKPAVSLNELTQKLKTVMADVLGIDPKVVDVDQPFVELGLDSFLGAELIVSVNKTYGTELSHLRLFDYSTVREFAQFLETEIRKLPGYQRPAPVVRPAVSRPAVQKTVQAPKPVERVLTTVEPRTQADKIAIIGMSGRYPKANDLSQYWENLVEGRNAITEVPSSRWDVNRHFDTDRTRKDKTYSKWLGAVDDVDRFDPLFFRISPQEAEYIDPQHRLFLQESYKAFEDAGYSTGTLSNRKCGVYLGISTNDYMSHLSRNGVASAPVTSNSYAIAAARIAYYLNLKGPAMSVDTACSSSLVAIHLASQALLAGEIDMALTGGVSLWLTPESYVAMSQAGMFSPNGQCKTFDDGADGIVNGEGIGAIVLKRLADAERDGDTIYGVILGSGINQDGRTNGITAPSVNSQIELERAIYTKYEIDPETITYVETHGTGTRLGDPIELEALATVFKEKTAKKNFCALGSVKSNIGHTTAAAGVAGLQKVLLSLRHRTIVPTLHVTKENSRFDFRSSPFYVSRETKAWDSANGAPRRAAVSSFGFSGTNAHLVIEEYQPSVDVATEAVTAPVIVPLSARTAEALRQRSRDLLQFLRTAQQPVDLAALAYTLQTGREPMEERLGLVVSSVEELIEKLSAYAAGQRSDGVLQGSVEPGNEGMTLIGRDDDMKEAIDQWIERRKLLPLLDLWTRGLELDWNRLLGDAKPRRISLPTYPFAKERCWIDGPRIDRVPGSGFPLEANTQSIEQLIDQIGDDAIDSGAAVHALRMLV